MTAGELAREPIAHAAGARLPAHMHVAVMGAGFAGLGLGIRLRRAGERDFVILERGNDVGGTWRDNRYPGVACDIPAVLYSYSFRPKPDWSRTFAPGHEILDYLRESARDEGVLPHLMFGTTVLEARWDAIAELWRIRTSRGELTADFFVSAAGRLTEPRIPEVRDLASFAGPAFHTSRWRDDVSLDGARVAVVGTGASAAQVLPHVASRASEVVVFQRSATWVVPREDERVSDDELARRSASEHLERLRTEVFDAAELAHPARLGAPQAIAGLRDRALAHLHAQVHDPALRAALTPDYAIGCKRVVISDEFYPAIARDNVVLEPSALVAVEQNRLVAASGTAFDCDVIVFATGFESTQQPFARLVHGVTESLDEHWSSGMTSYASTVVAGFPNFFVIDGPNASLGHNSAVYMIEVQLDYILGALGHARASGQRVLEVSADAEHAYTTELDERSRETVWMRGGCSSWYVDERSGRLTLLWPGTAAEFRARNAVFDPAAFDPAPAPARAGASMDA